MKASIDKKKKVQAEAEEIQDQIGIITAEIKMLTEEKSRLAELVVTNPDEWERNGFYMLHIIICPIFC